MRHQVYEPLSQGDPREIGGYRILARLGAGGMGRVFLGSTQSGRHLAVKVVRPEFADDPEFRRRFAQEVTAAQRVQNLYTAPVIDADLNGPMPWLATAHIPGPSLAVAVMESGPLPIETLYPLGAGIAEALQAIHRVEIVHRDLKPSNVLLASDGPRVIDFGIARAADATPLTRTGGAVGSPQFMAPEQVRGSASTSALDLFAFGSLLYFAATARSPFGDGPAQAVMFRIVQEEPRLDDCPETLRPLIEQCLNKEPSARPTAGEVLNELAGLQSPAPAQWLPEPVTVSLRAYAAVPGSTQFSGQQPVHPTGQTFPSGPPSFPPPRPAGRPINGKALALAGGATGLVLLLLFAMLLIISEGDDDTPSANVAQNSPESTAQPVTTPDAPEPTPTVSSSASPGATDEPGGGTKPPGTFLASHKGIDITDGYSIYFTDDPVRPREAGNTDGDLHFSYGSLRGAAKYGAIGSGKSADYETCHENTKYRNYVYDATKGSIWCVYTDTDLLGIITIKSISNEYLTIDLKVWQGPAD